MNSPVLTFLVACVFFTAVTAVEKACWMKQYGKLTMFNGDELDVELPCKYALADFNCNGYRINVTASNRPDKNGRFSPKYVFVNVTRLSDSASFFTRTGWPLLNKFIKGDPLAPEAWTDNEGEAEIISFLGNTTTFAVLQVVGGAEVQFSTAKFAGVDSGVKVTCDRADLSDAKDFDDATLCGGPSSSKNLLMKYKRSQSLQPASKGQVLHYVVLGGVDATLQTPECSAAATEFQGCPAGQRRNAVLACEAIFGKQQLAKCLDEQAPPLENTYQQCLEYVCDQTGADPNSVVHADCTQYL